MLFHVLLQGAMRRASVLKRSEKRKARQAQARRATEVAQEQGICVLACARAMYRVHATGEAARFEPCGHVCACVSCAVACPLTRCPLCRTEVLHVKSVHDGSRVHVQHAPIAPEDEDAMRESRYEQHVEAQRMHERDVRMMREREKRARQRAQDAEDAHEVSTCKVRMLQWLTQNDAHVRATFAGMAGRGNHPDWMVEMRMRECGESMQPCMELWFDVCMKHDARRVLRQYMGWTK